MENEMKQFTAHAEYNMETKKPYVEIKRDGEHYCYIPWSVWKK